MWKYFFLTCFLFSSFADCSHAASAVVPLSLKQCVDLALKNDVETIVARAQSQEARGEEITADADLLPQIDAMASQQRTWWENIGALGFPGFGSIGPFNTFNAAIMVSQRVLDLSALAHAQAGKIKWKASELETELANQQVILATDLAYIQTIGFQDELAASQADIRLAKHFLSLSLHQLNAGLASSVDVARNRTQLAQQEARQEQLRLDLIKSQLELKRMIKLPLSQPIELTDHLTKQTYDYLNAKDAITQAQQERMEMQVGNADSDYTLEELKASQRERLPKISLTGQFGEMGNVPQGSTRAAQAMVSISLPIWEGNRIAGDIKEKRGLNEEQKAKTEDLRWKIEEDVRLSLETLKSNHAELEAQARVENYAQRELNLSQDRFSVGLGDNTQVIDAQDALADARDKYVQALAKYNQAQLNYFASLGDPRQFDLSNAKEGKNI